MSSDVAVKTVLEYLSSSHVLNAVLEEAETHRLSSWWIVGGVIRDTLWSLMDGQKDTHSVRDIDLIYFDPTNASARRDVELQEALSVINGIPWSVKNQARMHRRNGDAPYLSIQEALYCAPETISTIGLSRTENSDWIIASSFGYDDLLEKVFRPTPHYSSRLGFDRYLSRAVSKQWLTRWPSARIVPW